MRLINTTTGQFEEFTDTSKAPLYAILSHTWSKDPKNPEQTLQDVEKIQKEFESLSATNDAQTNDTSPTHHPILDPGSKLSEKIRKACEVARNDGYQYIWVDFCCINKTSSSELSEAINSMFNWYRDAQICYAFLADVPSTGNVKAKGRAVASDFPPLFIDEEKAKISAFRTSRWFKRAWTLQELIAPRVVVFLSKDWTGLGTKHSLADLIAEITNIDRNILTHQKAVADESVAERMRWAASREATRVEDEAYSLLGIFGITMTTIYGEGRNAFQRLQEEILQRIPDRSLFAWCDGKGGRPIRVSKDTKSIIRVSRSSRSPFATSPRSFANGGGKINALSERDYEILQLPVEEHTLTPHGIRAKVRLISVTSMTQNLRIQRCDNDPRRDSQESWCLIPLGSQADSYSGQPSTYLLGRLCCLIKQKSNILLLRVADVDNLIWTNPELHSDNPISRSIDVYLPRPPLSIAEREPTGDKPDQSFLPTVSLSIWAPSAMPPQAGYTICESDFCSNEDRPLVPLHSTSLSVLLSTAESFSLRIQYRCMPQVASWTHRPKFAPAVHQDRSEDIITDFAAFIEARVWIVPSGNSTTLDDIPPYASAIWAARQDSSNLPVWYIPVPVTTPEQETTWILLRLWLGIAKFGHYHAHVEIANDDPSQATKDVHYPPHVETLTATGAQNTHFKVAIIDGDYHPHVVLTRDSAENPTYAYKMSRRHLVFPYGDTPLGVAEPHPDFKLTLLGTAKRALEAQGYSVHLEVSRGTSSKSHSHSHSLTISDSDTDPTFTISIRYFYSRYTPPGEEFPQFIIVACVTFQSVLTQEPEGPYVLNWTDNYGSSLDSARSPIYLTTPNNNILALNIDVDRAWVSEYYLVVNITQSCDIDSDRLSDHRSMELHYRLVDPHGPMSLALPTRVRRALEMHRYEVDFQELQDNSYRLTLSNSGFTINIQYSCRLSTGSGTFEACITTSSPDNRDASAQPSGGVHIVEVWDAWQPERRRHSSHGKRPMDTRQRVSHATLPQGPETAGPSTPSAPSGSGGFLGADGDGEIETQGGWLWNLPEKDVKLVLPNGVDVTLRLSLYLVWLSSYCITVEVNPITPLLTPKLSKNPYVDDEEDVGMLGVPLELLLTTIHGLPDGPRTPVSPLDRETLPLDHETLSPQAMEELAQAGFTPHDIEEAMIAERTKEEGRGGTGDTERVLDPMPREVTHPLPGSTPVGVTRTTPLPPSKLSNNSSSLSFRPSENPEQCDSSPSADNGEDAGMPGVPPEMPPTTTHGLPDSHGAPVSPLDRETQALVDLSELLGSGMSPEELMGSMMLEISKETERRREEVINRFRELGYSVANRTPGNPVPNPPPVLKLRR